MYIVGMVYDQCEDNEETRLVRMKGLFVIRNKLRKVNLDAKLWDMLKFNSLSIYLKMCLKEENILKTHHHSNIFHYILLRIG